MWQLDNRTPFAAERAWVRDRDGAEVWLVAVKATFDILPDGSTHPSRVQPPVLRAPEFHGGSGGSIKYETDLVPLKTTTDVLVVGHAYAPQGHAASQIDIALKVGPVQKVLRVFGDRRWTLLGPSSAKPFLKMPLLYERAFGGVDPASDQPQRDWDWRNPAGTGFTRSSAGAQMVALPNIEYPDKLVASWDDRPPPAGLGPVACHWQPRASRAGTYDLHWQNNRQPLLPEDFDDRFYQCAPQDQQSPGFLRGGEPVLLRNLSESGNLQFALPRMHLGFETRFVDKSREVHRSRALHTVIVEPDFPRVSLVWHSALPCHFKVHKLERTVVTLKTAASRQPDNIEASQHEVA
jgi:hypothetical protein